MSQFRQKQTATILFGDVVGFSRLSEFQLGIYVDEVVSLIAQQLASRDFAADQANTWGDGVVAFFQSPTSAVRCALAIRDAFRTRNWPGIGLPSLQIRISLHIGEVFRNENPITNQSELIGTEVNRTARIEPIVSPNQVYATRAIVEMARRDALGLKFDSIGSVPLAKNWPDEELFVCSRENEPVDVQALTPPDRRLQSFLGITEDSLFARQLAVSSRAKEALGAYCVESGFWKQDEVMYLDSGTIPVYLFYSLCTSAASTPKPACIITNNVACASISLRARNDAASQLIYPLDDRTALTMLGGTVLGDYSAILPDFVMSDSVPEEEDCRQFVSFLKRREVQRVVMMVTKLKAATGPCAVSTPMARFKKLLLRFVYETPGTKLVVVAEAAKLLDARPGKPIESIEVGSPIRVNLWTSIVESRRVSLFSAFCSELTADEIAAARTEAVVLSRQGIEVTMLSAGGHPIALPL